MVDGFDGGPSTLLAFAQKLNGHVQNWLTTDWKDTPLNVIIADNAFSIPYLLVVKGLKKKAVPDGMLKLPA